MCTVTLIPTEENDFILTSNRDEAIARKTDIPQFYTVEDTKMLFPKDAVAGGTWIGVSEQCNMICLLNGGFEKHTRKASYRKSRGVVVKELLASLDMEKAIYDYDCTDIEPFTIVAICWKKALAFYELVWDGETKHIRPLEKGQAHIWSSSTLYTDDMKAMRREWLKAYENEKTLNKENLIDFHKNAGIGDDQIDLRIDRGALKTVSITQVSKESGQIAMRYENLQEEQIDTVIFEKETA